MYVRKYVNFKFGLYAWPTHHWITTKKSLRFGATTYTAIPRAICTSPDRLGIEAKSLAFSFFNGGTAVARRRWRCGDGGGVATAAVRRRRRPNTSNGGRCGLSKGRSESVVVVVEAAVLLFACVPSFLTLWMIDSYNRPEILKYPFKDQWQLIQHALNLLINLKSYKLNVHIQFC